MYGVYDIKHFYNYWRFYFALVFYYKASLYAHVARSVKKWTAVTHSPRDQSFPAQPISIRIAQSRKTAHKPLRTSWILKKPKQCVCHVWTIINLVILTDNKSTLLCSLDLKVLRAQRIIGFFKYLNYPQINKVRKL